MVWPSEATRQSWRRFGKPGHMWNVLHDTATSQFQLDVSVGDPLTTVTGSVRQPDGAPAARASITIRTATGQFASTTLTDAAGHFVAEQVPTLAGMLTVSARRSDRAKSWLATAPNLAPAAGATSLSDPLVLTAEDPQHLSIAAGDAHTVALKRDGSLWS